MTEFLTKGLTGDTFEEGRIKINKFFTASTDNDIYTNGLSIQSVIVNNSLSATTIYSGGTEISKLINSSGPFRQEVVHGSNYTLYRDYDGAGSITSTLYMTGTTFQVDVDFIPGSLNKMFKFDWFQQTLVYTPPGYIGEQAGSIQFNQFDQDEVSETFSILGDTVGHYQYFNDPSGFITYQSSPIPDLLTSGVTATFYPDPGSELTFESGVTRTFVVQGILI